jgi:hypothetical protein
LNSAGRATLTEGKHQPTATFGHREFLPEAISVVPSIHPLP